MSSECVIWQGPDLPCITLCTGDSISDAVYKVAHAICEVKQILDLSDLDITTLFVHSLSQPDPEKTLIVVLDLLIQKTISLQESINLLSGNNAGEELNLVVQSCFGVTDADNQSVNTLPHSQYTKVIAAYVCAQKLRVDGVVGDLALTNIQIQSILDRLNALESQEGNLIATACLSEEPVMRVEDAVTQLATDYCELITTLGPTSDMTTSLTKECTSQDSEVVYKLANPTESLWVGAQSATLATSLSRIWLAICDLRAAVATIQSTCCGFTCEDVVIDFDVKVSDDRTELRLFFGEKTVLPTSYTEYDALGTKLTITDTTGHVYTTYVKIAEAMLDPDILATGVLINLGSTAIAASEDWNLHMDVHLVNGSSSCMKCVDKTITYSSSCGFCELTATGTGTVVITYEEL